MIPMTIIEPAATASEQCHLTRHPWRSVAPLQLSGVVLIGVKRLEDWVFN